MKMFEKEEFINGNDYTFLYNQNISKEGFKQKIENVMFDRGYQYKGDDLYEKGNGVLRMLFGALYKHYKMGIAIEFLDDNQARVIVRKRSSGFAGGVIGMNQIQKELRALKEIFKSL